MTDTDRQATRPRSYPGYTQLWAATTISGFGTYITTVALQVLVVDNLHASATGVGILNAARWVPYLLFGLVAGVLVDRYRRRPILICTDLARAALLGLIPMLAAIGRLNLTVLVGFMIVFGVLSLMNDAAYLSFVPRIVGPPALTRANARLQQGAALAQTTGPALAGGLVTALGAPIAVLADAISYLVSGILLTTIRTDESTAAGEPTTTGDPPAPRQRHLGRELREGLAWIYRHPMLAPLALTGHAWFLFNSMLNTVFVTYALRQLGIGALGLGVALAFGGLGGVLGSGGSAWAGRKMGIGPAVILSQWLFPVAFLLIVLARGGALAWVLVAAGQFLFGLAVGLGSPLELGFQQAITPDRLQGRTNATIRSFNRGVMAIGAPVGGLLADALGYRPALWIGIGGVAAAAGALHLSPFRRAELADR